MKKWKLSTFKDTLTFQTIFLDLVEGGECEYIQKPITIFRTPKSYALTIRTESHITISVKKKTKRSDYRLICIFPAFSRSKPRDRNADYYGFGIATYKKSMGDFLHWESHSQIDEWTSRGFELSTGKFSH